MLRLLLFKSRQKLVGVARTRNAVLLVLVDGMHSGSGSSSSSSIVGLLVVGAGGGALKIEDRKMEDHSS